MEDDDFEPVTSSRGSDVWNHFLLHKEREEAKCLHCKKKLSAKGRSTKGLLDHLRLKHNELLNTPSTSGSKAKRARTMNDFFKVETKMTLETKISRLCSIG